MEKDFLQIILSFLLMLAISITAGVFFVAFVMLLGFIISLF